MAERRRGSSRKSGPASPGGGASSLPPLEDGAWQAPPSASLAVGGATLHGSVVPGWVDSMPPHGDALAEFFHDPERDGHVVETEVARPREAAEGDHRERVLLFGLGPETYGVSIMHIREILKPPVLTEVPRVPRHVLGVFSLRGTVLPVVSLAPLVGVADSVAYGSEEGRVLVVGRGEDAVGFHVHKVEAVARMNLRALEPPPGGISRERRALVLGLGREEGRLVIVLNLQALLASLGLHAQGEEAT